MLLSFVIPCYGSERTIENVCESIHDWGNTHPRYDYEIICVNDASPDNLKTVLKRIAETNRNVKVIELATNRGKHAAMMAGFSIAQGELIVNLDDDGQCPIESLQLLIDAIFDGADIAMAKYPQKQQNAFKIFCSRINRTMATLLIGQPKNLDITNFSIMRRFVAQEILHYTNPYPYMNGLMLRTTKHIASIEMEEHNRILGESGYTFKKSLKLFLDGLTAFSIAPLRPATVIGMICAVSGFISGISVVVRKLLNPTILAGYSSLMAVFLFIGGMLMLMLGLIGEYIGRIYISINNSPQYVIRETINVDHICKETEEVPQ